MNEKHYQDLKEIIKIYLPEDLSVNDITPESDLIDELNINSANLVDIVLDLEEKFDITLDNDDMHEMQTVKNALQIIQRKLDEK
jgi:acyl carrier protein